MLITDEQRQALEIGFNEFWELSKKLEQKTQEYRDCLLSMGREMSGEAKKILNQRKEDYITQERELYLLGRKADLREERKKWDKERTSFIFNHSSEERQGELGKLEDEYEEIYSDRGNKIDDASRNASRIAVECTQKINEELELRRPGCGYKFEVEKAKGSILEHKLVINKECFLVSKYLDLYLQLIPNSDQDYCFLLVDRSVYGGRGSYKIYGSLEDLLEALKVPGYVDEPTTSALENVEGAQNLSEALMSNCLIS